MFWSAGCALLMAEGFSCSLCVLYGGLRISKLQFSIRCKFFSKPWIRNWIQIRNWEKCWIRIRIKSMRIHNPAKYIRQTCCHDLFVKLVLFLSKNSGSVSDNTCNGIADPEDFCEEITNDIAWKCKAIRYTFIYDFSQGCGSASISSGSGSSIVGWTPIRIRIQSGSKALMTKNWKKKKLQQKKIKFFFWSKTAIYLSIGLHKVCPSYSWKLQLSKEAIQHFKTWTLTNFSTFVGHFCPPGSGSGFRIRIHWPDWIRIQSGSRSNPDPIRIQI